MNQKKTNEQNVANNKKENKTIKKNDKKTVSKNKDFGLKTYFLIGSILGAILFIAIYGVRVLDFTYDTWLLTGQDLQQHYLGWKFYRDCDWAFPLGMQDGIINPNSISVLYTDSIPLFALIFKALSPVLPETFQYFGLFGLMCYVLNGGFAAVILAKFNKSKIICAMGSVFFILASPVLQRLFGLTIEHSRHTSLAAHFLILGAFAIWVHKDRFKSYWKPMLGFSVLGVLCVLIQMYIIFMVGGIMCGYLLNCLLEDKDVKRLIYVFGSFGITSFLAFYLVGGLSSGVAAGMEGFGIYSANLNTFINPFNYSIFLKKMYMYSGQYEGMCYLGLGMILLSTIACILCLGKAIKFKKAKSLKARLKEIYNNHRTAIIPGAIVVVVFALLGFSNQVYFNSQFIIAVYFPGKVNELLAVFRSSGRFMWCVMYIIMAASIFIVCRMMNKKVAAVVLALCLALQITDLSGMLGRVHNTFANETKKEDTCKTLSDPFWDQIPEHYNKVMFCPIVGYTKRTVENYLDIGAKAAANHMKLNYFYLSRPYDGKKTKKEIKKMETKLKKNEIDKDTLYILDYDFAHRYKNKMNLYLVDGKIVGTKEVLANATPYSDIVIGKGIQTAEYSMTSDSVGADLQVTGWEEDFQKDYSYCTDKARIKIPTDQVEKIHVRIEVKRAEKSKESVFYFDGRKVATLEKNDGDIVEFDANIKKIRGKLEEEGDVNWLTIATKKSTKLKKDGVDFVRGIAIGKITVTDISNPVQPVQE